MDKAVIDFTTNNLKNVALSIIDDVKKERGQHRLLGEIDKFHAYTRMMLLTSGLITQANKSNPRENHLLTYSNALEKIISVLIVNIYGSKGANSACNRAIQLVEKYKNPEEVIENDRKAIYKILIGEK